jgi:hypothetical protein
MVVVKERALIVSSAGRADGGEPAPDMDWPDIEGDTE